MTNKRFYGWFAVTGAALGAFAGGGIFFYAFGVFLPAMCDEFGWSRAVVGLGMSLGVLAFGLPSPLVGILVSRFEARANLIAGNLIGALGLAGMFLAHQVWQVYLFYTLAGLGCCIGGVIPATTIANNWFIRNRSLAIGLIMACGGLGGFTFPLLATALLTSIGWRTAWLVLAGILFLVASLIGGFTLARNRPEEMGQVPDGIPDKPQKVEQTNLSKPRIAQAPAGWTMKRVFSQPTIWLIVAFSAASGFVSGTITGHQVAYLRDLGSSPMIAASTLSVVAGSSIIGSLVLGTLAIKLNTRRLLIICFIIRLVSLVILLTTKGIALIYIYAILFGISNGAIGTAMFTIVGTYYGRASFARTLGVVYAFSIALQAAGPAIAGAIYDTTGTYTIAFIVITFVTLIGLICAFLARPPKLPKSTDRNISF